MCLLWLPQSAAAITQQFVSSSPCPTNPDKLSLVFVQFRQFLLTSTVLKAYWWWLGFICTAVHTELDIVGEDMEQNAVHWQQSQQCTI